MIRKKLFSFLPKYKNSSFSESSYSYSNPSISTSFTSNRNQIGLSNFFTKPRVILISLIALLLIGFAFWIRSASDKPYANTNQNVQQVAIAPPLATKTVNKDFTFSLRNDKGEEVSKFKYTIQSAELRNEILVKGQRAQAVAGRSFLILNVKLSNDQNQTIAVNTRDYIRLSVNGNDKELLAPDIHNDPVEVQAISTKYSRLGFPVNESDKNFKIHVGEIKGDKTVIDLNIK